MDNFEKTNKMNKYQFKTNINCGGCVAAITPHLDKEENIKEWKVNTASPTKELTVETEGLSAAEVKAIVEKAGYKAEEI